MHMTKRDDFQPLYRYFQPQTRDYLFTPDPWNEPQTALYRLEGLAGFLSAEAQEGLTRPLYRWSRPLPPAMPVVLPAGIGVVPKMHFYTTDPGGEDAETRGYSRDRCIGHVLLSGRGDQLLSTPWWRWQAADGSCLCTTHPEGEYAPAHGYRRDAFDLGEVFPFDLGQWMQCLDGSQRLSAFTLPGTHDSATYSYAGYGFTKCQTLSFEDQLHAGIRFLDIRCFVEQDGGRPTLGLCHGAIRMERNFQEAIDACLAFLDAHRSECIVMSVKNDAKPPSRREAEFSETFRAMLRANLYYKQRETWYTSPNLPTLDQARGRIVLLRRFQNKPLGIDALADWPDNATKRWRNADGVEFSVQDRFNNYLVGDKSLKFERVRAHLEETAQGVDLETLHINYTSGTGGVWPHTLATGEASGDSFPGTNRKLSDYLAGRPPGRYGIVPMDFPEFPGDGQLIRQLVCLNPLRPKLWP